MILPNIFSPRVFGEKKFLYSASVIDVDIGITDIKIIRVINDINCENKIRILPTKNQDKQVQWVGLVTDFLMIKYLRKD